MTLQDKTVPELKAIAKQLGVAGYSKMKKDQLVYEIEARQATLHRKAVPLSEDQRTRNYLAQTGRKLLTPRQRRRLQKKANRALAIIRRGLR